MTAPTLDELPPPPPGRTGWPWTEASPPAPAAPAGGWPRISVVTPSFNQGGYLEETIRSVLLQGYPDLEYFVLDGGSRDESRSVIERYAPWLSGWVSEPDRGQTDAITKGLARCTGTWFNWINSDDLLAPGALFTVAAFGADSDCVAGACEYFGGAAPPAAHSSRDLTAERLLTGTVGAYFQQPSTWLRREGVLACGSVDPNLHYAFDWDLAIRYLAASPRVAYADAILSRFRLHAESKTCAHSGRFIRDQIVVCEKLLSSPRYARLHDRCRRALRQFRWYVTLETVIADRTASRVRRLGRIAAASLCDPPVRFSRYTAGAARRVLARDGRD